MDVQLFEVQSSYSFYPQSHEESIRNHRSHICTNQQKSIHCKYEGFWRGGSEDTMEVQWKRGVILNKAFFVV